MANPTVRLALAESLIERYNDLLTEYEITMDSLIKADESGDDEEVNSLTAEVRTNINVARALIGYWRGEAAFWRNEINENKTALKDSNKLASSS